MKLLRILILIFFLVTAGIYGYFFAKEKMEADNEPPVFTADYNELLVSVNATNEELLAGLHAADNIDGDVTDSIVVVSKNDFITKGTLKVNYAAFDSHDNVATYTRKIIYTDYRSPHFSADAPFRYVTGTGNSSVLANVTVDDVLDGNITNNIRVTNGSTTSTTKYPMVLQVTNSAGDTAAISINAYLQDRSGYSIPAPALDEYIIYVKKGNTINIQDLIIGVYQNGSVTEFEKLKKYTVESVTWEGDIDYDTPGEYVVVLTLNSPEEESDDMLGIAELYIIVEED